MDGVLQWSSTGTVSYKSSAWWLTAVSDHTLTFKKPPPTGAHQRQTTFVGWNNLLNRMVSRYLFVTDYDSEGQKLSSWCLTSKEERQKGYIDPFVQVEEGFLLDSAFQGVWQWKLPQRGTSHGTQMSAVMNTEVDGKHTINASVASTKDAHQISYSFKYRHHTRTSMPHHDSITFKYMEETCDSVKNFWDVPQICVDDLLAVEYECGYAELAAGVQGEAA